MIAYFVAGLLFCSLALALLTNWRERAYSTLFALAISYSAFFTLLQYFFDWNHDEVSVVEFGAEIGMDWVWLILLSGLFEGALGRGRRWFVRYGPLFVLSLTAFTALLHIIFSEGDSGYGQLGFLRDFGSVTVGVGALISVEQVWRNVRGAQTSSVRALCVSLILVFGFELLLFSDSILNGQIRPVLWDLRAYALLLSALFSGYAALKGIAWSPGIFVSRQVVFYSATLLGSLVYLCVAAFIAYYFGSTENNFAAVFQSLLFVSIISSLIVFLLSKTARGKTKVAITKNFFRDKYDYREEWQRLINTLNSNEGELPVKKRAIKSLAQIVAADSGLLCLYQNESEEVSVASTWNLPWPTGVSSVSSNLVRFLSRHGWIVDIQDYKRQPQNYGDLNLDSNDITLLDDGIVVPLFHNELFFGFVVLYKFHYVLELDFEDRDLLKTAGKQVASHLAQEIATEQLASNRQFEALNKMTAFLMHDLKNAIAQQSLVVDNSEKHRRNPEFVDDAMDTVRASVARMKKVVTLLQQRSLDRAAKPFSLESAARVAVNGCVDRSPVPKLVISCSETQIYANEDSVTSALQHAIDNAQDAAGVEGSVTVSIRDIDDRLEVCIADDGEGMDSQFIAERLFKPFDSTKGTSGMGIGAYQIREALRHCGGDITVESDIGTGTRFFMFFPQVR